MIAVMNPAAITQLLAEAKDAFGSANADKLSRLVERLAAALAQAVAVIETQRLEMAKRDAKIDDLLKRLDEQAAELAELKTKAGERTAELVFLRTQVFGPKSERLRYQGDGAETTQNPAGIDDDETAKADPKLAAAEGGGGVTSADVGANDSSPQPGASIDGNAATSSVDGSAITLANASDALPGTSTETGDQDRTAAPNVTAATADEAKKERRRRARQLERSRTPQESKRTVFGPEVAHEIMRHLLPADLKLACPLCGDLVKSRGKSVESREIDAAPSTVITRTHHRDKAACGCGALSFVMPGPVRAVANMVFSPAFAAQVLVDKFFAHLPLNRQAARFGQQGLKISRDRLVTLVIGCWLAVEAVVKRMRELNRAQSHQGCDESSVRVVVDGEKEQRFIWCLTSPLAVTYQITQRRNKATAREVVGTVAGVLTSDRLAIYRKLFEDKAESGCMSHLRRYFWYALDTAPDEAMPVIELIGELYDVETEAKNKRLEPEDRQRLRAEKSSSILARLEAYLKATAPPPRTPLAKAVNYAASHWAALTYYVSDGAVEIDNNECERRLRLPKLGWANWKQPQSELGIEAVAGFYSLISTCALHKVNPRRYLADVLTKLATGWPASRLDELLPWNWQDDSAVHGPPAPQQRSLVHTSAEIIELARVRARAKAARVKVKASKADAADEVQAAAAR